MKRVHNFNPGPGVLPMQVLENASKAALDYKGKGLSLLEMSHRSKDFEAINNDAMQNLKDILSIPSDYEVIFMQGGASLQFVMIPMNFLPAGETANYVDTGVWASKAHKEASILGKVKIVASSKEQNYNHIPKNIADEKCAYTHITSNNTIRGTQYPSFPTIKNSPLICDMSSDFISRPVDVSKFSMIYAGAQKNAGPSGVTIMIMKKSFLEKSACKSVYLNYLSHSKETSLYNTPCTFAVYCVGEVFKYVKEKGIKKVEQDNKHKAGIIYDCIDKSNGFYKNQIVKEDRSLMNIPFNLPSEELEAKFLEEAKGKDIIGLKGHRSMGGCRASTYNSLPIESCEVLVKFMEEFKKKN